MPPQGPLALPLALTGGSAPTSSLAESEARFRAIADAAPVMIWVSAPDKLCTYCNAVWLEFTGRTLEQELGDGWAEGVHPDDLEFCLEIYSTAFDDRQHFKMEYRLRRFDGVYRRILDYGAPLFMPDGRFLGFIGSGIDISERKETEKRLSESEARLGGILDIAQEAIVSIDEARRIVLFNRGAEQTFGYSRDEVIGRSIDLLIPESFRASHRTHLAFFAGSSAKSRLMGERREIFGRRKDGEEFPAEASISKLDSGGDKVFTVILRDVSGRKRVEKELRRALLEVEQLKNQLQAENVYLQEEIKLNHNFGNIIGQSAALESALHRLEQVAITDATLLITGETGTGKELFARSAHDLSRRRDRPMVKVNCAALPPSLIEDELFGHVKGAFTGARNGRVGRFELADRGTLFLDEIGDLPIELQVKLLRYLEEGELERVGDSHTLKVDVRVIAATHQDLAMAVQAGDFREDLYYRLNVVPIAIPPLRERREDIQLMVRWFVEKFSKAIGKTVETVPRDVMAALSSYDWPGNIRELENVIERAVILSTGPTLQLDEGLDFFSGSEVARGQTLQEVEKEHVVRTLEQTGWIIEGRRGAAKRLGLHPATLRSRMKKMCIERPAEPR